MSLWRLPPIILVSSLIVYQTLAVTATSISTEFGTISFAGIYKTYILPNNHPDKEVRLKQLVDAVKLVYASIFYQSPRQYAKNADIRIEEEKMAVLIQELAGEQRGDLYYPVVSGVAQSYNYYPFYPAKPEHGTVSLALGLGKAIVDGERVYRYSPAFPRTNPHFSGAKDYFENSQTEFYALSMSKWDVTLDCDEDCNYDKYSLQQAEKTGALKYIGSTYCAENDCIYDNIARPGPKLVTFAPLLKQNRLPLNDIVKDFLLIGKKSFGSDVEIEFALDVPQNGEEKAKFYFLQIRPMVGEREALRIKFDDTRRTLCQSSHTVGNAVFENICDIIFIRPDKFDIKDSNQIAREIGILNAKLAAENRRCILIGFGRLGTSDPWLGIPLSWAQMSQAHVVIEVDTENLCPEPSLGSHFFHNLTSMNMGYFHVAVRDKESSVDWQWLMEQKAEQETERVKLVHREEPFLVMLDGKKFAGRVYI